MNKIDEIIVCEDKIVQYDGDYGNGTVFYIKFESPFCKGILVKNDNNYSLEINHNTSNFSEEEIMAEVLKKFKHLYDESAKYCLNNDYIPEITINSCYVYKLSLTEKGINILCKKNGMPKVYCLPIYLAETRIEFSETVSTKILIKETKYKNITIESIHKLIIKK